MIHEISYKHACEWFRRLPKERQISTLSPEYCAADARRDPCMEPIFVLFIDERGFWLHSGHRARIPGADGYDIQSPYGYGGPVTSCDVPDFLDDAWNSYCEWCRSANVVVEFMRLHPMANWQAYRGTVVANRQTVYIRIGDGEHRAGYSGACARQVRKGGRFGLALCEYPAAEILDSFAPRYLEAMRLIEAESFYFFCDDYFRALAEVPGVRLFACQEGNVWLAAGVFLVGGDCLEYHLGFNTEAGRSRSAMNYLFDAVAGIAEKMQLSSMYLGGGTDCRVDNPLFRFKSGFSHEERTFSFGYAIHDAAQYKDLRCRAGYSGSRVLFYR